MAETYEEAEARLQGEVGTPRVKFEHWQYNGKTGLYCRAPREGEKRPPRKEQLLGVVLYATKSATLWPQGSDKKPDNGFTIAAKLCVSKNIDSGVVYPNRKLLGADFATHSHLEELGYSYGQGGCNGCPLLSQKICKPGYELAIVLLDEESHKPLVDGVVQLLHFTGAIAFNGVKFGLGKISGNKRRLVDSIVELSSKPFSQANSPEFERLSTTHPELREYCLGLAPSAFEAMRTGYNPFRSKDDEDAQEQSHGPASEISDGDIPF